MNIFRTLFAFFVATIVGTLLVSVIATQINLAALASVGAEIPMGVRLEATLSDLASFGPTIGAILLIGFAAAFWVAHLIIRRAPPLRLFGYELAGFVTVIVVMQAITLYYAMAFQSGITPVPASRTLLGLLLMGAGGAGAGLVYARLARR